MSSGTVPESKPTNEKPPSALNGLDNEASRLASLAATARDQDDLEKDVGRQADQLLIAQADERDQKRLERTLTQHDRLSAQAKKLRQRIEQAASATTAVRLHNELEHLQPQIDGLDEDVVAIQRRIEERHEDAGKAEREGEIGGNRRMAGESKRDFLIRTGKITPFSNIAQPVQPSSNLADIMLDAEGREGESDDEEQEDGEINGNKMSHRNLLKPGFMVEDEMSQSESTVESIDPRPRKRLRLRGTVAKTFSREDGETSDEGDYKPAGESDSATDEADKESDDDYGVMVEGDEVELSRKERNKRHRKRVEAEHAEEDLTGVDDGNEALYQARLRKWVRGRKLAREKARSKLDSSAPSALLDDQRTTTNDVTDESEQEEWFQPHPTRSDAVLDDGLRIPGDIYPSLFDYQKTGVQWLSELYSQQVGGIIGDEMGLGKTIQVISFLAGLHYSQRLTKPVIVVTPATVMKQWVNEFHRWWPPLRVSIIHSSGSGMMNVGRERVIEDELDFDDYESSQRSKSGHKAAKEIVDRVLSEGHVLVTTYSGLQSYAKLLISVNWGYAVLDEGHKIRNPNAAITIYCKELRTPNRIILSGTPMQNNLTELWSLFDFIFPMRLGTLVNFRQQFDIPIKQGGYANASNLQVETALQCAQTLKDAISPYLLQRFKVDVAADLPKKSEQVLFCRLTKSQREAYESFLSSNEMDSIIKGKRQALYGIDMLRKICNHPDLQDHRNLSRKAGYAYGSGVKSGKMQVVKALLELWRDTGHKTLLFAQHRIMLDILESFVKGLGGFNYRRMDGTTLIKDRQDMVDEFNRESSLHLFLLTTKVGGLGINLTGADRVIIYDPDWNPSTDMQARERAWRLGQKREVMIYRLMTAGSIEEKIYHRQIFKQFLTNKILRDPKQRQTFQLKDLHDLFTLGDANDTNTETSNLFGNGEDVAGTGPEPEREAKKMKTIFGIVHQEAYKTAHAETMPSATGRSANTAEDKEDAPPPASGKLNDPSKLMNSIFARSGVHSAFQHDSILNPSLHGGKGSRAITADPEIIAREAKKLAAQAARELQRANEVARQIPAGTPTWTGTYGIAGREDDERRRYPGSSGGRGGRGGTLGSAAILSNLSLRQSQQASSPSHHGGIDTTPQPKGKEFLTLIRDYLQAHGGAVYTQMLIDHFNRFCGTPSRTAEFKEMLRTIAVLERSTVPSGPTVRGRGQFGSGGGGGRSGGGSISSSNSARNRGASTGRGRWVLKREFGGTA